VYILEWFVVVLDTTLLAILLQILFRIQILFFVGYLCLMFNTYFCINEKYIFACNVNCWLKKKKTSVWCEFKSSKDTAITMLSQGKQDNSLTNQLAVNLRTSLLAEMFNLKFGVYNSSKCYFRQITLFICCQYLIGSVLGLGLGLMYK